MRKRTVSREYALQVLYQLDITQGMPEIVLEEFWRVLMEDKVASKTDKEGLNNYSPVAEVIFLVQNIPTVRRSHGQERKSGDEEARNKSFHALS